MRGFALRGLVVMAVAGSPAFASTAGASARLACASVSHTVAHTGGRAHAALNNLIAVDVSCTTARSVARTFLVSGKPPPHWHASSKTLVTHTGGQANTVSQETFTRGSARVTGDIAN